ncbi:unnamed protein product [Cladocopium goreaui]|uniref:Leucine-rich repeat and guanylate kinase domain-containing protein n=1 Tax=Cladocopium goreaui TaxID=2562237 RepID=A0A9P1DGI5_9DINO|nr:unnamed protein product [Cladocopium goreaui]
MAMQFDPRDRCLHICMLGDAGIGHSSFLKCYGAQAQAGENAEDFSFMPDKPLCSLQNLVAMVELDGEPCRVRFTDEASGSKFDAMREAAIHAAHVHMLCFRADQPETFASIRQQWLPTLWEMQAEAPWLLVALAADVRERNKVTGDVNSVPQEEAEELVKRFGGWGYLECSAFFPETVQMVVDEALTAAYTYYRLQWQLHPPEVASPPRTAGDTKASWTAAPEEGYERLWLPHETLTVADDHVPVTEDQIREGLSQLGDSCTRQHAYVRCDLMAMNLTSLVKIRQWDQLQFLNVSRNRLQSLEPLGALRHLLHLNASHNLLIRSESFTAPDALETCDMSYNMLAELGDWKVHRYLRELNLRGNYISYVGSGLKGNHELRMLDLSENFISKMQQNLDDLELRTLNLAQNKLSSLEGVQRLSKLHCLDVRHNHLTSISALKAEDIPRLRKLRLSENRISQMREVDQLASFAFLSELYMHPNPVSQLPQYRAQVLHRLPRLRQLDNQQVTPEERVKTEVIYGADVETRQDIFEQLLPEETFVDRRLMTEALISQLEVEQFGRNGDAGPFGCEPNSDPTYGDPPRTKLQMAKFRQRVEQTRRGGFPEGVANFSEYPAPYHSNSAYDEDLAETLEAVAEGGCEELWLGAAEISPAGIREIIAFMQDTSSRLCHIDLAGCSSAALLGAELLKSFPLDRGCSIELENCGLADSTVARLRNKSEDVSRALNQAAAERRRIAQRLKDYAEMKEFLNVRAERLLPRGEAPEPPPLLCHPAQWLSGSTEPQKALEGFLRANPNKLMDAGDSWTMSKRSGDKIHLNADQFKVISDKLDDMLTDWGCDLNEPSKGRALPPAFVNAFGASPSKSPKLLGFMIWEGVAPTKKFKRDFYRKKDDWQAAWADEQRRMKELLEKAIEEYDSGDAALGVASGQLIAHLSFLSGSTELKDPSSFNLVKVSEESPQPRHGEDLHSALSAGLVVVEEIVADGFGVGNLKLTLRSLSSEPLIITIRKGTVFQQKSWTHRSDLLTGLDYMVALLPESSTTKEMLGHSFTMVCPPPSCDEMLITDFYVDLEDLLGSQALIWDHFQNFKWPSKPT